MSKPVVSVIVVVAVAAGIGGYVADHKLGPTATTTTTTTAVPAAARSVATAPAQPGKPTSTAGNMTATVTWSAPATGGSTISSYAATSATGAHSCSWTTGPLTCTVRTLTNGTPYSFIVVAHNRVGTSPGSPPSTPVVPATTPSQPSRPTVIAGDKVVTVAWSAPTSGGSAITKYLVSATKRAHSCIWAGGPLSCTVSDLKNGTAYTFTVVARNAVGASSPSEPSNTVKPEPTKPAKLAAPSVIAGDASVTATWTDPEKHGGRPVKYMVTSTTGSYSCTTSAMTCKITNLTNGHAYTFTVVARNSAGVSTPSTPSAAVVPGPSNPATPKMPEVTGGNASVTATWTRVATRGSRITRYVVVSTTGKHACAWTSGPLKCTVTGLKNGTAYVFTLVAHNSVGTSPPSGPSKAVTPEPTTPAKPNAPSVTAGNASVTANWVMATTGGSPITKYVVSSTTGRHSCTWTTGPLTCTVTTLMNRKRYRFRVVAHNDNGTSQPSPKSTAVKPKA